MVPDDTAAFVVITDSASRADRIENITRPGSNEGLGFESRMGDAGLVAAASPGGLPAQAAALGRADLPRHQCPHV